jgi:hypothetical protein
MGAHLNTRADLTLRCRAMVRLANAQRVWFVLNDDLLRATVVRALNRMNGYALGVRRSGPQARLDALVWSERGAVSGRPHVHGVASDMATVCRFGQAGFIPTFSRLLSGPVTLGDRRPSGCVGRVILPWDAYLDRGRRGTSSCVCSGRSQAGTHDHEVGSLA